MPFMAYNPNAVLYDENGKVNGHGHGHGQVMDTVMVKVNAIGIVIGMVMECSSISMLGMDQVHDRVYNKIFIIIIIILIIIHQL